MKLRLGKININDLCFGEESVYSNGTLFINKEELLFSIHDDRFKKIDVHIAKPGESTRICPVKDVLEPRVKVSGRGKVFSKKEIVGEGETLALKGMSIMTVGKIVGFQEGIVDMSGTGAEYTPFSKTNNLVLECERKENLSNHDYEEALRNLGIKTAQYVANIAKDNQADEYIEYESKTLDKQLAEFPQLPKVAYVYMLQTQGLLHDTYLYGVDCKNILPTFVYPTEIMDGAIISGNCVSACDKNTSYHHLNNPIIEDLYEKHGKELNFIGIIVSNENIKLAEKELNSNFCTKLVKSLGVEGVIISKEGFGNPDTDLIMNCKKMESEGVKTVLITDEYAGRDGASQSLADADPFANAVISCGNANEVINLSKMEKTIGCLESVNIISGGFEGSLKEDGSISIELQAIIGATNELGFNLLGAVEY